MNYFSTFGINIFIQLRLHCITKNYYTQEKGKIVLQYKTPTETKP